MEEKDKFWHDTPEAETHRQAVCEAAEQAQKQTQANASKSIKSLAQAEGDEFWQRWGKYSPQDPQNVTREPISAMGGPVEHGGGSKSGKRKKSKKASDWRPYMINY